MGMIDVPKYTDEDIRKMEADRRREEARKRARTEGSKAITAELLIPLNEVPTRPAEIAQRLKTTSTAQEEVKEAQDERNSSGVEVAAPTPTRSQFFAPTPEEERRVQRYEQHEQAPLAPVELPQSMQALQDLAGAALSRKDAEALSVYLGPQTVSALRGAAQSKAQDQAAAERSLVSYYLYERALKHCVALYRQKYYDKLISLFEKHRASFNDVLFEETVTGARQTHSKLVEDDAFFLYLLHTEPKKKAEFCLNKNWLGKFKVIASKKGNDEEKHSGDSPSQKEGVLNLFAKLNLLHIVLSDDDSALREQAPAALIEAIQKLRAEHFNLARSERIAIMERINADAILADVSEALGGYQRNHVVSHAFMQEHVKAVHKGIDELLSSSDWSLNTLCYFLQSGGSSYRTGSLHNSLEWIRKHAQNQQETDELVDATVAPVALSAEDDTVSIAPSGFRALDKLRADYRKKVADYITQLTEAAPASTAAQELAQIKAILLANNDTLTEGALTTAESITEQLYLFVITSGIDKPSPEASRVIDSLVTQAASDYRDASDADSEASYRVLAELLPRVQDRQAWFSVSEDGATTHPLKALVATDWRVCRAVVSKASHLTPAVMKFCQSLGEYCDISYQQLNNFIWRLLNNVSIKAQRLQVIAELVESICQPTQSGTVVEAALTEKLALFQQSASTGRSGGNGLLAILASANARQYQPRETLDLLTAFGSGLASSSGQISFAQVEEQRLLLTAGDRDGDNDEVTSATAGFELRPGLAAAPDGGS